MEAAAGELIWVHRCSLFPRRRGAGGRTGVRALPAQKDSCRILLGHGKGRYLKQNLLSGITHCSPQRQQCRGMQHTAGGARAHLQLVTALLPPCQAGCSEHPPAHCTGELGLPEDHKAASSAPTSTTGSRALPPAPVGCWPLGLLFLGALEFA